MMYFMIRLSYLAVTNVIYYFLDAIKEAGGLYFNVSLTELNQKSVEFLTKAGTCSVARKKKVDN